MWISHDGERRAVVSIDLEISLIFNAFTIVKVGFNFKSSSSGKT